MTVIILWTTVLYKYYKFEYLYNFSNYNNFISTFFIFFFWERRERETLKIHFQKLEMHHSLHLLIPFWTFLELVESEQSYLYGVPFTHSSFFLSVVYYVVPAATGRPLFRFIPRHACPRLSSSSSKVLQLFSMC